MPFEAIKEMLSPAVALLFMGIFARGITNKVNSMEEKFVTKEHLKTELGHGSDRFDRMEGAIGTIVAVQSDQRELLGRLDERTMNMDKKLDDLKR